MAVEPSGGTSIASPPRKRVKSGGNGTVGCTVHDSDNGVHCHQCRQKTRNIAAACQNQLIKKPCLIKLCRKCLLNRYGEKVEAIAGFKKWICPKCRGICNCSVCMKRRGHQPTGILINAAKATRFGSVSERLVKSAERVNKEIVGTGMEASLEKVTLTKELISHPRKRGKENSSDGQLDAHLPKSAGKKAKKVNGLLNGKAVDNTTSKICNKVSDTDRIDPNQNMPKGTDLTSVARIDVPAEDIGNALELLEFCSVFGKILELKNGEAEYVLQDIFHGRAARRVKFCPTVQFHMHLLKIIQTEQGVKFVKLSTYGQYSWFKALKQYMSESQPVFEASVIVSLKKAADYDALNASEKLRVLNLLCIEVLGTKKLRNWIEDQNTQLWHKAKKEAKQKVLDARDKIKTLEQKTKDDIAKSIDARDGEQEAAVSHTKSEAAQAHALLGSNAMLLKINQTSRAVRVEPVFMGHSGHVYWELNCSGEYDVLHQYVGKGDTLSLNEKWFALSAEEKEVIKKHISVRRGQRHQRTRLSLDKPAN